MLPSAPRPSITAGTADSAMPIDLHHLAEQTLGDRDLQAELLVLFAHQAKGILHALEASLGPEEPARQRTGAPSPRAADLLHTLSGSARAVGSWRVAAEAADMERELRSPGGETVTDGSEKLAALGRSVGQVCAAIDDLSHGSGR